jgi:glutaredoxin 3
MAEVEIYTTTVCPYCVRAKSLLDQKGVSYTEIKVDTDDAKRQEMVERADGRRSVPQIFVNGQGLGGSDDIHEMDRQGKLDPLLQA